MEAPARSAFPTDQINAYIARGCAIGVSSKEAAIAYQNGPPAILGTFDFAYVGFAVVWGVVFFAEIPNTLTLLSTVMIVIAGIVSLRQ